MNTSTPSFKSSLKSIICNNRFYKKYIQPLRQKIQKHLDSKLNDEAYFTKRHKSIFGYIPNFKHPQTFNEKIIHRILFDRNPIYTALADKLKARIYIATMLSNIDNNNTMDNNKNTIINNGIHTINNNTIHNNIHNNTINTTLNTNNTNTFAMNGGGGYR